MTKEMALVAPLKQRRNEVTTAVLSNRTWISAL
jgi:hypothetical protein